MPTIKSELCQAKAEKFLKSAPDGQKKLLLKLCKVATDSGDLRATDIQKVLAKLAGRSPWPALVKKGLIHERPARSDRNAKRYRVSQIGKEVARLSRGRRR